MDWKPGFLAFFPHQNQQMPPEYSIFKKSAHFFVVICLFRISLLHFTTVCELLVSEIYNIYAHIHRYHIFLKSLFLASTHSQTINISVGPSLPSLKKNLLIFQNIICHLFSPLCQTWIRKVGFFGNNEKSSWTWWIYSDNGINMTLSES